MLRDRKISSTSLSKYFRSSVLALTPALLLAGTGAWAASPEDNGPVRLLFTVPIPVAATNKTGGLFSWDISFVNQTTQTLYVGDRSNQTVDVVDAKAGTFLKQIIAKPPFAGAQPTSSTSGPDGVVAEGTCLFVTDAPSRVVSFIVPSGTQVSDVHTSATSKNRTDELAFDPKDNLILAINNADTPPFATLISVGAGCKLTVGKQIPLPFATGGAEQPVWDPGTQRFFLSIPQLSGIAQIGAVVRINPKTAVVDAMYSVAFCSPAGLALNPTNHTLLVGCNTVFDTAGGLWSGTDPLSAAPNMQIFGTDGFIQAVIPGAGVGDEVWYNGGDDHFYTASSGSPLAPSVVVSTTPATPLTAQGAAILGVIDGTSQRLDQLVPTFNVPKTATHPAGTAHSVAANDANNFVFVTLAANNVYPDCLQGCVAVYGRNDLDLPGTTD